jgi:hypothetical protein
VFGDRFVGRIEPRIDRGRGRGGLSVWWQDGQPRADGFVDAMRDALRATFGSRADRLDRAAHLATEKRLLLTRPSRDEWRESEAGQRRVRDLATLLQFAPAASHRVEGAGAGRPLVERRGRVAFAVEALRSQATPAARRRRVTPARRPG